MNESNDILSKELANLRADSEEKEKLTREVETLKRQLGQSTSTAPEKTTTAPPTANIKPMAGQSSQSCSVPPRRQGETPFARIGPISMPQRSVAVLTAVAVSPQQIVHTTGNAAEASSSPTSSHTDYMPATSSASAPVRQAAVPPTQQSTVTIGMSSSCEDPASTAELTQVMEIESGMISEPGTSQQSASQQTQQAVALVLPRVEQISNEPNETQSSTVEQSNLVAASSQQASSSNTVTTSQAGGTKRTRETEDDSSGQEDSEQQTPTPQVKRTRVVISESGGEVEYQVPTSSQRDQEDDVICVDSDDDEEEEEEDQEEEPDDGVEVLDEPEYDEEPPNNEVEVIDNIEVAPEAQVGAQSEAISSASSDFARGRNVAPLTQGRFMTEESGDDSIVPSTPTLYVPRRTDGFGEAVSSPHVPSGGRFTFNEPTRTNTSTEQVEEGDPMDDGTGRSVPTTPLQVSPQGDVPAPEAPVQESIEEPVADAGDETDFEEEAVTGDETAEPSDTSVMVEEEGSDGVSSEGEKPIPESEVSHSQIIVYTGKKKLNFVTLPRLLPWRFRVVKSILQKQDFIVILLIGRRR